VPMVNLSFLNRRTVNKQVCRVCHGVAELKSERLCGDCIRIKAQLRLRFPDAVRRTMAIPTEQQCKRSGCSCAACDGRTLDPHPLYLFDLARGDRREIHFHPRCHELWLEGAGLDARPEHGIDIGQG
jgi:hypothetical protein